MDGRGQTAVGTADALALEDMVAGLDQRARMAANRLM